MTRHPSKANKLRGVGIKCERAVTDEKMGKDVKRAEKMRKEPTFMRKQALLYRNKVFFKEGIYKT